MSTAHTTLFYGVYVRSGYLCFASDAYKETKGSFLAIDLVCSRRRKGTLLAAGGSLGVAARVPEEVWKMIKLEIGASAVDEAEQAVLDSFGGEHSLAAARGRSLRKWNCDSIGEGEFEGFLDNGGISDMIQGRLQDIRILLRAFGLALPCEEPYSREESPSLVMDALSASSLPLSSTPSYSSPRFPYSYCESLPYAALAPDNLKFSKSTFALPCNADLRTESLLSFFHLQAMNPDKETVHHPRLIKSESIVSQSQSQDPKTQAELDKAIHGSVCCEDAEVKPHWQMWMMTHRTD